MILLAVLLVTCLMLAFRLTPAAVLEAVRSHERVPYEPEDDEEEAPPTAPPRRRARRSPRRASTFRSTARRASRRKKEGKLSGFFTHKSDAVRTPDELLTAKAGGRERSRSRAGADSTRWSPARLSPRRFPRPLAHLPRRSYPPLPQRCLQHPRSMRPQRPSAPEEVAAEAEKVAGEIESELEQDIPSTPSRPSHCSTRAARATPWRRARSCATTPAALPKRSRAWRGRPRGRRGARPSVTRYEFTLDQGVKLSKITNLADDIALCARRVGRAHRAHPR